MRDPEAIARSYRRHAEADTGSPLRARVAAALGGSEEAVRAIAAAPARGRGPAAVLAALHDLALDGCLPALAAAHAAGDGRAAARAAVDALVTTPGQVLATAAARAPRTDGTGRCAVLRPLVAEAAWRTGAGAVGLVDLGCAAGLGLLVDRVGITYDPGGAVGDPASPVQLSCAVVGERPVPAAPLPAVVARVGVDADPLDPTDPDDVRWLRACLPPDRPERIARLHAEVALAAADPPLLLRGDPVELLPDAVARVPAGALPVVLTAWALSRVRPAGRPRLLRRLGDAAAGRPVAWVSAEGVGVAPGVPTLGDRRASGHSILGVAVAHRSGVHVEAVGRCWSRGRTMMWLAGA